MEKLVFNASMPRAGSELLQCLLHQNPRIYGSPTSPLLEYQFGARQNYNLPEVKSQDPELMLNAFIKMCAGMAESYYGAITDRPVVIDKNRGWSHYYEWVNQWNPNPKMICVVRDLRAIFASMERIYRANRHSPESIDNPAKLQNMTLAQRIGFWSDSFPVGLAILRTKDLFDRGLAKNILFIRYEDLCSNPQKELNRVYDFIEEPHFTHDFESITKEVREDDSFFGMFGRHSIHPALKPHQPNSWEDVIPRELANEIRKSFFWYFDAFGY